MRSLDAGEDTMRVRKIFSRRILAAGTVLVALGVAACSGSGHRSTPTSPSSEPAASPPPASQPGSVPTSPTLNISSTSAHPRLWITATELPRLRAWASDANPVWASGLKVAIDRIRVTVDRGRLQDDGSNGWVQDPVESYAEALAFASLIEPDVAQRGADAERARKLLMRGISAAAKGSANAPYRSPSFAIDDRSRWWGESWPLTVDWIYPYLSTSDKATIRAAFLNWIAADTQGGQTTDDHPMPIGVYNSPRLLADPVAVKWATNNYYTAHARNIALMALALDPADDPGGVLSSRLRVATGGFLYVTDALLRTGLAGGAAPDGMEYGPQSLGYVAETLLALHSAGVDNPVTYGRQVTFNGNPFWDQVGRWVLSSLSPAPVTGSDGEPIWLPVPYGDAQNYGSPDWIQAFGPLGIYDESVGGHANRLAMSRWIEQQTPPGGVAGLLNRVSDPDYVRDSILYFLLFDPAASPPSDPRPPWPTLNIAPGVGEISDRTGWGPDATWFTFTDSWNMVDHQSGDGLSFGLFRRGEWLTKAVTGYDVNTSDFKNTLAVQNDPPEHNDPGDYRHIDWEHGSQYGYIVNGPGRLLATSDSNQYLYVTADATNLYNSSYEGSTDVVEVVRSIVWLKPDIVVVNDRVATHKSGRFKRFFLQLPRMPATRGDQATITTAKGQQLALSALLPAGASLRGGKIPIDSNQNVADEGQVANGEPMKDRLEIDAPGNPAATRFLNVIQALDTGQTARSTTLVQSSSGTPVDGAAVGATVVLFPVQPPGSSPNITLHLPSGESSIIVTGLQPRTAYAATVTGNGLSIHRGAGPTSDSGGVLAIKSS
jgi:hypothetical protein